MLITFFTVHYLLLIANCKCEDETIVWTSQGFLDGLKLNSVMGSTYFSFRGIPYAAPPVGELRFKAPQPPPKWNSVRDAKTEAAACMQLTSEHNINESYSEDCLFINVYSPKIRVQSIKELLPVMVWIHGESFSKGSSNSHKYGPDFFLEENVVLVTFNYRLGVFGFLNMGTADCQGNAGLKDQVAALRWVAREICNFGGNPNSVTVFGEGAGAASVNHLYLSPLSQGLFHRAISQSGSSLCTFAFQESTYESGLKLAENLGCPTNNVQSLVACLKRADPFDLVIEQFSGTSMGKFQKFGDVFIPTLEQNLGEEVFFPQTPIQLIKSDYIYGKVPYILGFNNREGASLMKDFPINPDMRKYLIYVLMNEIQENSPPEIIEDIIERLNSFYFDFDHSPEEELDSLAEFLTDRYFSYDIIRTARMLDKRNIYLYYFQYLGNYVQNNDVCKTRNIQGVCHGGELGYMFYSNLIIKEHNNLTAGSRDLIMLQRLVRLWTNFAKYGVPTVNIRDPLLSVIWEPTTRYTNAYLDIQENLNMTYDNLLKYSTYIWDSIKISPVGLAMDTVTFNNDYDDNMFLLKSYWSAFFL